MGRDFNDQPVHVCDVRTEAGSLVAQKVRTKDKDFWVNGSLKERPLVGMHLWNGGRKLVITEGEIDMLSYAQLTDCKYPVVSLPNGAAAAKKALAANLKYLERFDEVILMFDMDEPGQAAAVSCMPLMNPGRIKIAKLPLKDANECLLAEEGQAVVNSIWNAEAYRPSQIVTVADIMEKAKRMPALGLSFPWESATKASLGIRKAEIHIVGAAPKIGKTEHQHQLIKHMVEVHGVKPGIMSLEENPVKTLKKIAGKNAGKQFTKPPEVGGYTQDELDEALEALDDKMEFYSSEGVRDYEEILSTVRWWAAQGIWFFIIDPLTALVAEHDSSSANDILNEFMSKAASMAMELNITFFMYSHVNPVKTGKPHDAGGDVLSSQFTGSRAMEKWAHYGWAVQRDRTEKDPTLRNTARISLLFDREFGEWCEFFAFYNNQTNDWSECPDPSEEGGFQDESQPEEF
ncbi:toprim domain-containing protein [Amphritea sp. HPY]|uniref:toprim domain-containing protein n=1 Tax=Amphritea sp. HPY TaxID=3421652 RepID=UPI003D7D24E2